MSFGFGERVNTDSGPVGFAGLVPPRYRNTHFVVFVVKMTKMGVGTTEGAAISFQTKMGGGELTV